MTCGIRFSFRSVFSCLCRTPQDDGEGWSNEPDGGKSSTGPRPRRRLKLSCFTDLESYVRTLTDWVDAQRDAPLAPMIYATTEPQTLQRIQAQYGDKASSERVEQLFAALAAALKAKGFTRFIVAGGETSSIVAQTLGVEAFHIGPTISPGVPWVRDTRQPLSLALKSGNFGDIQFFARAQQEFRHD